LTSTLAGSGSSAWLRQIDPGTPPSQTRLGACGPLRKESCRSRLERDGSGVVWVARAPQGRSRQAARTAPKQTSAFRFLCIFSIFSGLRNLGRNEAQGAAWNSFAERAGRRCLWPTALVLGQSWRWAYTAVLCIPARKCRMEGPTDSSEPARPPREEMGVDSRGSATSIRPLPLRLPAKRRTGFRPA